ncbi:MAG: hypothetical protein WCK90_04320 [archaeon]
MAESKRLKMAVISGASHAIKYKEQNPHATADEILRHVTREIQSILDKIDSM